MKKFARLSKELKKKICKTCGKEYFKPIDWSNMSWLESKYCSLLCLHTDRSYEIERRRKISIAQKGRKLSKEWKMALSKGRIGMKFSKSHCENMSKVRKGLPTWNKGKRGLQVAWNKGKEYLAIKGEKNWNWKGGITPINKALRETFEYEDWRKKVFERDLYTCQSCGEVGGRLEAHHIKPFSLYPELRFDLLNGRTLCKPCHHKIGWRGSHITIGQNI